jgi:hypothetical protein
MEDKKISVWDCERQVSDEELARNWERAFKRPKKNSKVMKRKEKRNED